MQSVNPYKSNVLFVGNMQTVQTQIRRHKNEASDAGSPLFAYRIFHYIKFGKINTNNPSNGNGLVQLINVGNSRVPTEIQKHYYMVFP